MRTLYYWVYYQITVNQILFECKKIAKYSQYPLYHLQSLSSLIFVQIKLSTVTYAWSQKLVTLNPLFIKLNHYN